MATAAAGVPASESGPAPAAQRAITTIPSARLAALAPDKGETTAWGTLCAYYRLVPNPGRFVLTVFVLINLRNAPAYIFPLLSKHLLNLGLNDPKAALKDVWWVLLVTLGLCIGNILITVPQMVIVSRQRRRLTAALRQALMRRLHRITFAFHDQTQAGALVNKFSMDTQRLEALQGFLTEGVMMQGFSLLTMLCILGWMNPWLFAIAVVLVPLNIFLVRMFWSRIRSTNDDFRKAEASFMGSLNETLNGVRVTRAHAVEEFTEKRLGAAAGQVAESGVRLDFYGAVYGSSAWATSSLLAMIVLSLGIMLLGMRLITAGDVLVLTAYFAMLSGATGQLVGGLPAIAAASSSISSLAELFRSDHEKNDGKPQVGTLRGEVRFSGVVFDYPNTLSREPGAAAAAAARAEVAADKAAKSGPEIAIPSGHSLNGLDLEIPAGTSLALVGRSGSGKSTTASLLLGFYEAQQGTVAIDGHDLRTIDMRSVRRQVGVVSQDVVLFQDSVLGNIAWGDKLPDVKRAEEAARRANAWEFIARLPRGIDTVLGDRGAGLSGGQRQRLAIARALYRDPRLLILDEATSALDPESERLVQAALDELMRGRSTVIIAHRLSTVRRADRIAVLDAGRVVESGPYDELMAKQGAFHALATGQLA
jgi:ATP-binding cassette subfamily B protein